MKLPPHGRTFGHKTKEFDTSDILSFSTQTALRDIVEAGKLPSSKDHIHNYQKV